MRKTHPISNTTTRRAHDRPCAWPDCDKAGEYRAPKARDRLDDYHWFCLDHVRDYNGTWNYFEGMSNSEFDAMIRSSATWERPTWPLGRAGHNADQPGHANAPRNAQDPWIFWGAQDSADRFRDAPDPGGQTLHAPQEHARMARLGPEERRALTLLGLDETATLQDVKKRYKQLVKRYHPDANGGASKGDVGAQERLRAIIQAYSHLVDSGLLIDPV